MPDINKLPKWAQQYIADLEVRAHRAEVDLQALNSGTLVNAEDQKFYTQRFRGDPFFLQQYSSLYFKQDPASEGEHDLQIVDSNDSLGGIEVRSGFRGRLVVIPRASNVVHIALIDD